MIPPPTRSTLFPYTTLFRSAISRGSTSAGEFEKSTSTSKIRACDTRRSEEHTSELQSRFDIVCRLLLEKKMNETHLYDELVRDAAVKAQPVETIMQTAFPFV